MKKITLTFPDHSSIEVQDEIRAITLVNRLTDSTAAKGSSGHLLAIRLNNEICSLDSLINISAKLEPVYDNTSEGAANDPFPYGAVNAFSKTTKLTTLTIKDYSGWNGVTFQSKALSKAGKKSGKKLTVKVQTYKRAKDVKAELRRAGLNKKAKVKTF